MSVAVVCGLQLGWVTLIAGMVESWLCAAGHSTRVAGVGRVVEIQLDVWCWYAEIGRVVGCSWMIVAGSWDRSSRWMQLDSRCWQLRSVESLNVAGSWSRTVVGKAEVGRVVLVASRYSESSWLVVAMLGQSVTASRLRGLDAVLLERRGR